MRHVSQNGYSKPFKPLLFDGVYIASSLIEKVFMGHLHTRRGSGKSASDSVQRANQIPAPTFEMFVTLHKDSI
jgi:hypothetical protein